MPWLNQRRAAYVIDSPPHKAAATSNAMTKPSRNAQPCHPLLTNQRIPGSASSLTQRERDRRRRERDREDQQHDGDVNGDRHIVLRLAHRGDVVGGAVGPGGLTIYRGAVAGGCAGRTRVSGRG